MPIPAIVLGLLQAAASVLPVIAQIRGDKTQSSSTQNLAIASRVLDVVTTSVGAVNQQAAVEAVTTDPVARAKADEALKAQFFDLLKFAQEQESVAWDRGEKSTAEARSFAERMTAGEGWRAIGYGALIGLLAVLIIGGSGVVFSFVLFSPNDLFDSSVRAGIIETIKAIVILIVGNLVPRDGVLPTRRVVEHRQEGRIRRAPLLHREQVRAAHRAATRIGATMEHDPRMTVAAQASGISTWTGTTYSVRPVPDELMTAYIPPQYVGRPLPGGAFKSLWPDSRGITFGKWKAPDWSPDWRPPNWEYRPDLYD